MARYDFATLETAENAVHGATPDALFEMGLMYATGREVDYDLVAAHKWFNLASMRGNKRALRYRQEIASEMSKEELRAAQREARAWLSQLRIQ